jgi:uncharacterized protein (DUF2235 family)
MKRLVVCCDGTWNKPDQMDRGVMRPSNVVRVARFVLPQAADGTTQMVYYDKGVGTGDFVDRLFGGAFGIGLRHNVVEAYDWLSQHYAAGDELWFFGFSRGAYTVRRVAGMLRKCGLIPPSPAGEARKRLLDEAYGLYCRRETEDGGGADSPAALAFREGQGTSRLPIRFIGVWDTVGAYGIGGVLSAMAGKARFHDRRLSGDVQAAYQAVAIDEQRSAFVPALWEQTGNGRANGQVLEQAWFAGVHTNVGGGYQDTGLSDITLRWLAARAEANGLDLDDGWRDTLAPDVFGELRDSRRGLYRLMSPKLREIGVQAGGEERLHVAAFDRMQRDPAGYAPENLLRYLGSPAFRLDDGRRD